MKTNRGISAKDVLDEVQKKRKHKHKHKEAGQDATASTSATVRRLEEAHQARDQLQKAQQEAEARRKEIQEKEAECILAQTKIAELEGRLQAQREANAIEVEAKDKVSCEACSGRYQAYPADPLRRSSTALKRSKG